MVQERPSQAAYHPRRQAGGKINAGTDILPAERSPVDRAQFRTILYIEGSFRIERPQEDYPRIGDSPQRKDRLGEICALPR